MRTTEPDGLPRRAVLGGILLGLTSLAGCAGGRGARNANAARPDFDGWLSAVPEYDGIVDRTGRSTVTVAVGGDDGLSFDPVAVQVDTGTTVRWVWIGGGAAHNVVAHDRSFASETYAEAGRTFEQTFDTAAVVKYLCVPHEYAGMKGVIVVGT